MRKNSGLSGVVLAAFGLCTLAATAPAQARTSCTMPTSINIEYSVPVAAVDSEAELQRAAYARANSHCAVAKDSFPGRDCYPQSFNFREYTQNGIPVHQVRVQLRLCPIDEQ